MSRAARARIGTGWRHEHCPSLAGILNHDLLAGRGTLAVMLPLLIVATVAALVPCALGAYIFLVCTGSIK